MNCAVSIILICLIFLPFKGIPCSIVAGQSIQIEKQNIILLEGKINRIDCPDCPAYNFESHFKIDTSTEQGKKTFQFRKKEYDRKYKDGKLCPPCKYYIKPKYVYAKPPKLKRLSVVKYNLDADCTMYGMRTNNPDSLINQKIILFVNNVKDTTDLEVYLSPRNENFWYFVKEKDKSLKRMLKTNLIEEKNLSFIESKIAFIKDLIRLNESTVLDEKLEIVNRLMYHRNYRLNNFFKVMVNRNLPDVSDEGKEQLIAKQKDIVAELLHEQVNKVQGYMTPNKNVGKLKHDSTISKKLKNIMTEEENNK